MEKLNDLDTSSVFHEICNEYFGSITNYGKFEISHPLALSTNLSQDDYLRIKHGLDSILKQVLLKDELNHEDIKLNLEEDKKDIFISCLRKYKPSLLKALLCEHNSTYCNTITDFDWKIKLIIGTSGFSPLTSPLLELNLNVIKSDINKTIRVSELTTEMSKDMIDDLIATLQCARNKIGDR